MNVNLKMLRFFCALYAVTILLNIRPTSSQTAPRNYIVDKNERESLNNGFSKKYNSGIQYRSHHDDIVYTTSDYGNQRQYGEKSITENDNAEGYLERSEGYRREKYKFRNYGMRDSKDTDRHGTYDLYDTEGRQKYNNFHTYNKLNTYDNVNQRFSNPYIMMYDERLKSNLDYNKKYRSNDPEPNFQIRYGYQDQFNRNYNRHSNQYRNIYRFNDDYYTQSNFSFFRDVFIKNGRLYLKNRNYSCCSIKGTTDENNDFNNKGSRNLVPININVNGMQINGTIHNITGIIMGTNGTGENSTMGMNNNMTINVMGMGLSGMNMAGISMADMTINNTKSTGVNSTNSNINNFPASQNIKIINYYNFGNENARILSGKDVDYDKDNQSTNKATSADGILSKLISFIQNMG